MSTGCSDVNTVYGSGITISRPADSNLFVSYDTTPGELLTYNVTTATGTMSLYIYWQDASTIVVNPASVPASNTVTISRSSGLRIQTGGSSGSISFSLTCAAAPNANLSSLDISAGSLSPSFSSSTTSYTASVANSVTSITVSPTVDDHTSTVTVNGSTVTSGTASSPIALDVGANTITTVVTASDGTTTKTYTTTVTRAGSSDADLSALSLSSGALSPAFASGTTSYTAAVPHATSSTTVTPTTSDNNATVTVNGDPVASGSPSAAIALATGANTITIVVTAQDGTTTQTTTLSVTRGQAASDNANLSSLSLSEGQLSPSFSPARKAYKASVPHSIASLTVTPSADDSGAAITVNGTSVASGSASGPIALNVGANSVVIEVTAADGTKAITNVKVTRQQSVSKTIAFTPSGGALPQAMEGEAYTAGITTTASASNVPLFSVTAGALPAGLTLNVSTGELTGPLALESQGEYSFTISGADQAGSSGSAAYTLKVVPRAITASDKTQVVEPGVAPPSVYLNSGATGGPFTDAKVTYVEPAEAGQASIIQGELAAAAPSGPFGYYLKFVPAPGFSGQAKIGYILQSALGSSNASTVTYSVALAPAAAAEDVDRKVRGFVKSRQNLLSSNVKTPGLVERRRMARATDGLSSRASGNGQNGEGVNLGVATSLAELRAARSGGSAAMQSLNVWVDGTLIAHKRDETQGGEWGSFGLLSAGVDYLVSPRALIGVSLHFDRMTDPTDPASELTGNGWLAGPYASLEIASGVFFDANLLYGGSSNDIDTAFFDGSFDTTRWIGSLKISGQWQADDGTTVTPRLKAVYLNEDVDGYAVANQAGDRLFMESFAEEQIRLSIGVDFEKQYLLANDLVLTPALGAAAGVSALDNSGLFGSLTAGVRLSDGMAWDLDAALLFNLEGDGEIGAGGKLGGSVRF